MTRLPLLPLSHPLIVGLLVALVAPAAQSQPYRALEPQPPQPLLPLPSTDIPPRWQPGSTASPTADFTPNPLPDPVPARLELNSLEPAQDDWNYPDPMPIATILPPSLAIPELPPLRDPARYLPENRTIYLLLKLSHRTVYVYQGQKLLASYPVAIGRPEFPTPTGEFQVNEMIVNPSWQNPWTGEVEAPGADGSLGLRWIGFTATPGGVIGFHGTPNLRSIGQAASHGCVRMRNEDIVNMYDHVKLGTTVRVEH